VTATVTPDAGAVTKSFAPSGQLLTLSRANGTTATYHYDRDRLVGVSYSDGTPEVTYAYGADGAGENGAGRVVEVVDGAMARSYGYDEDGNVARETATMDEDPFGKGVDDDPPTFTTAWEYDSLGRIVTLTYPSDEVLTHDYDLGGRPVSLVSQAPQHDLYDQYGNTVARPDVEIVYVAAVRYDEFGSPTHMRTGTGVETDYEYEPTRRFLAGIDTASTSTTQFDGTLSVARPLQALSYTYDAVGNVRDVVNGLYGDPTDTSISQFGPPPENNVPGPSQQAYTYDPHYRIVGGAGTYVDQQEVRDFTYTSDYGPNGNLLAKRQVTTTTSTTSKGGGKPGNPNGKKGDGTGTTGGSTPEPTCESNTGSGGGSFNQDPETTFVIAPGDLEYATDADGNQIHQLVRLGLRDYSYDANGNRSGWVQDCASGADDISRSFTYDAENRVTRIAEGSNDTDYRYNADGARTLERGSGGTTWFVNEHWRSFNGGLLYANVYLGEQMVASHRTDPQPPPPAPCTDTLENPCQCSSGGACLVDDVAECDLTATIFDPTTSTCQPKEQRKLYFFHTDLQGSMRVATDQVGGVHQYMEYLPTGTPWVAGQDTIKDTPNLFAGGWTDATYKLVNFGERWYDPREQHFLSPEPLLEEDPYAAVDDPSLLSAYTYAASNPMRFVDRDGRAPKHAFNGFELGEKYEKHQTNRVTISISISSREKRSGPAITFGGRYGNDAQGQQVQAAFQKHADRADRFSTILSISTEDGVRKVRVFGGTVSRKNVGDPAAQAAPDPAPGDTGAADAGPPTAPPDPAGAQPAPTAQPANAAGPNAAGANAAAAGGADGAAAAPPPAQDADAGGDDAPAPPPPPPPPPANASPAAAGPDD
jgi:RHS repeat-associated protein